MNKSGIHIKNPLTRKRAIFAQNAAKWHHMYGGLINPLAFGGGPGDDLPLNMPSKKPKDTKNLKWFSSSHALSDYNDLVKAGKLKEANEVVFGGYADRKYAASDVFKKDHPGIIPMTAADLVALDTKKYTPPKDYEALMNVLRPKVIARDNKTGDQFTGLSVKTSSGVPSISPNANPMTRFDESSEAPIVNPFDLGGILQGVGGVASGIPGIGGIIGAGVGLVGSLISGNKQKKEQEEAQRIAALQAKQQQYLSLSTAQGGLAPGVSNPNMLAYGGIMPNHLERYENGGTHQQNPLGGIPVGMGKNGKMNTVEEGEVAYYFNKLKDGKKGKVVFTNKITL